MIEPYIVAGLIEAENEPAKKSDETKLPENLRPHHRGTAAVTACSDIIAAQLLCTVQQLCAGVFVGVFPNYGVILQPEYLSG